MILFKRIIPIILPLIVFVCFEIILFKSTLIYLVVPFLFIAIIFLTSRLLPRPSEDKIEIPGFARSSTVSKMILLSNPLLLVLSSLLFLIFLENKWLHHILSLIVAIVLGLFLEDVFVYSFKNRKYQIYSLENISNYLILITSFFFYSGLYSLAIFLKIDTAILLLLSIIITFLLALQNISIYGILFRQSWLSILVIVLICAEVFWVLGLLPSSFYINGLILTTVLYITLNINRLYLIGEAKKEAVRRYLVIGLIILIVTLGTARWT